MFEADDIVEIRDIKERPFGNKTLLISDKYGYWALINNNDIIKRLSSPAKYGNIVHGRPDCARALELLWKSGILLRNGKRRTVPKNPYVGKPMHMVLKLTLDCSLRCTYCYASAGAGEGIGVKLGKRAISDFLSISRGKCKILFHGGEPFLEFEKMKELYYFGKEEAERQKKNLLTGVLSNGTIMNDDIIDFFKESDMGLAFSFDCTKKAHDSCRVYPDGSGSYEKVLKTLERVSGEGIHFNLITVVNKQNYTELDKLVPLMERHEIPLVTCNPMFFGGRGKEVAGLGITGQQYFEGMKKLLDAIIEHNLHSPRKIYEINTSFLARNMTYLDYTYMCLSSPCGAGIATLSVMPNGDVYPCDEFIGMKDFLSGNIANEPLEGVMQGSRMKKVSNIIVENIGRCSGCDWKRFCGGGCRSKNYHFTGKLEGESPLCEYYKRMIPYMISLLSEKMVPVKCMRKDD